MFYDVTTKYKDDVPKVTWTFGRSSGASMQDLIKMMDDPELEYIKISMSAFWRNKRDEKYKRTKSV